MRRKLKCLLFCIIFCLLLGTLDRMYAPVPFFYNERKDSFNILYFGSSYSYCTFNPAVIDDEEIHSYNLASQQQTIPMTYYVIKEALKYQHPEIIVIEPWYFTADVEYPKENVIISTVDKMRFGRAKMELIVNNAKWDQWLEFLIPLSRLHTRFDLIKGRQARKVKDENRGFVVIEEAVHSERPPDDLINYKNKKDIPEINRRYLEKIIMMAQKEDIQLLFVKAPMPVSYEAKAVLNSLEETVRKNDIPYIDYTCLYDEILLDFDTDMLDREHLNVNGGTKVSSHLKGILKGYLR